MYKYTVRSIVTVGVGLRRKPGKVLSNHHKIYPAIANAKKLSKKRGGLVGVYEGATGRHVFLDGIRCG